MSKYFDEIYRLVSQIPCGKVSSYGQLAHMLGIPGSARVIGRAMHNCPEDLPWHRVVRSDGSISSGVIQDLCRDLLQSEGVLFMKDGRVDMASCLWDIEEDKKNYKG